MTREYLECSGEFDSWKSEEFLTWANQMVSEDGDGYNGHSDAQYTSDSRATISAGKMQ